MKQQQNSEHIDELIISYLDGELPIEKEDAMFTSLASNAEDSRSAMRELISMRNVIPHDMEAFTPPPMAKDAVFSKLGMSSIPQAKEESKWKKALLPLVFLALGLAGGYGIGDSFSSSEKNEVMQLMNASMESQSGSRGFTPLISGGTSSMVPNIVLKQIAPTKIVYKDRIANMASVTPMITLPPISVNQGQSSIQANTQKVNAESLITKDESIQSINKESNAVPQTPQTNDGMLKDQAPAQTLPTISISNIESVKYPQFWMQVRGMFSIQSPEFSGIRQEIGLFDNSRVTFAWSLGDHFAIGLEAGREPFVLNYEGIKEDRLYQFNQYSPMLSGGLFLQGRTSALEYLNNSRIYAQAIAGGTEIGLLGRIGMGISYPISRNVALQLGLEQSFMQFEFQGNSFNSRKLDLLYGISINF